jgi:hypothetical protein
MEALHRFGHLIRPRQDVNGQAVRTNQEFVSGRDDAAREVATDIDDTRSGGSKERVRHLPHYALESAAEQSELNAVAQVFAIAVHSVSPQPG